MHPRLRQLIFGLLQGSVVLALAFIVPVMVVTLFAAEPPPETPESFEGSHRGAVNGKRGLVLTIADQRCGCPPVSKDVNWSRWPTRCRPENDEPNAPHLVPMANNDGQSYPRIQYPLGYPAEFRMSPDDTIPFPGWPIKTFSGKVKSEWVPWRKVTSKFYRAAYTKEWGGTAPSAKAIYEKQNQRLPIQRVPRTSWQYWQIHHILERYLGGTNHPKNLVPVFSRPNRISGNIRANLHNEFTQWWSKITVDSDVRNDEVVWKKIKGCRDRAEVWPVKPGA